MPYTLDEFWYTSGTMGKVRGSDYHAFYAFDTTHLIWLGAALIVFVVGFLIYRRLSLKAQRGVLISLEVFMLLNEAAKHIVSGVTDQWVLGFLPLHLCSINIFICLWYTIYPNDFAGEFLYAVCIPGAAAAMFSPSWTRLPVLNLFHLHSFTIHIALILFPILLLAGGFRPNFKHLWKVLLLLVAMCIPIYVFDIIYDVNFFFLNGNDNNPLLLLFDSIFPDYRIGMPLLAIILWTVMYLPWIIANRKNSNTKSNSLA